MIVSSPSAQESRDAAAAQAAAEAGRVRLRRALSWPPSPPIALLVLASIALAIFAIRLTGLPDLVDNEYRLGACVLNAIQGGRWLSPHDSLGNIDKPPMLTWLSALASLPTGHVTRFTLYVPTALATLGVAWLLFLAGRRRFGSQAGFLAGFTYLLSYVAAQQVATARWDGLFAFTVTLVALTAFRAWNSGGGWTAFWLAGAASTLTKGPLGILLGALGLGAVVWERRSGHPQPLRGSHALGIALFLLIVGGWFAAASLQMGPHLYDDLIRTELFGHIVMHPPGYRFRKPISDFLADFAPWSVLTIVGLWRIWRSPPVEDEPRRFERFCFCWFVGGLVLFTLSPHNPARLLYPVIPPAALIAGRELDRLTARLRPRARVAECAVVTALALAIFVVRYHYLAHRGERVRRTLAILELSHAVHDRVGNDFPLTYVDDVSFALQLTFNTMRPTVTVREAAALLREETPAYVVVHDAESLRRALGSDPPPLYEVATASIRSTPYLRIMSNRPRLEWSDPIAVALGRLRLRLRGARLGATQDGEIALARVSPPASVTVTSDATEPTTVALRVTGGGVPSRKVRRLPGGESWQVVID